MVPRESLPRETRNPCPPAYKVGKQYSHEHPRFYYDLFVLFYYTVLLLFIITPKVYYYVVQSHPG